MLILILQWFILSLLPLASCISVSRSRLQVYAATLWRWLFQSEMEKQLLRMDNLAGHRRTKKKGTSYVVRTSAERSNLPCRLTLP